MPEAYGICINDLYSLVIAVQHQCTKRRGVPEDQPCAIPARMGTYGLEGPVEEDRPGGPRPGRDRHRGAERARRRATAPILALRRARRHPPAPAKGRTVRRNVWRRSRRLARRWRNG